MLKQNIILKTYYTLKHIVNSLNDGTMWTLILTSVFIITYFIFLFKKMSMFTCSGRRRERNLFTISPAAENTLSDGTDEGLLHCHQKVSPVWQWSFFLDGTVNWGSTNSIRVLKSSPSTKLIGSIYLAIISVMWAVVCSARLASAFVVLIMKLATDCCWPVDGPPGCFALKWLCIAVVDLW